MKAQLITAFVLTLAAGPVLANAQASCPGGWERYSVEGSRCLRVNPPPPIRWLAGSDAELYTADADLGCVSPAGGRCAEEIGGHRAPLIAGIALLSVGYATAIGAAAVTGTIDHISPNGGEAALNLIPLAGPTIATIVAYESGGNGLLQFAMGLLSSILQLGGTIFTLVGVLVPRTVSRDAEGREVHLAEAGELRWIGPNGFALAF